MFRSVSLLLLRPAVAGVALALACGLSLACAKRPVLYPNARYHEQGAEVAEQHVDRCFELADEYGLSTNRPARVASQTTKAAVVGGATGAAAGAVRGRAKQGAKLGAAAMAASTLVRSVFASREPDPIERSFVAQCLADHGYRILGWK